MLQIVRLVERLVPGLLGHAPASVVCICTTRPKYLVFDGNVTQPVCVVEFGPADRLQAVHSVQSELHDRLPARIPRSVCCVPCDDQFIHIQEGRPGVPWFRLSDRIVTGADWEHLLNRAATVMVELHGAIAAVPAWTARIDPGFELARQAHRLEASQIAVSPQVRSRIEEWSEVLGRMGTIRGVLQHGDFAINNLLVSADSMTIIDFDEFGRTFMPLHDAFGLALSAALSQDGRWPLPRSRCVRLCVERSLMDPPIGRDLLPGLLMHHLLCRINLSDGIERRSRLREALLEWAEELAEDPASFFGEVFPSIAADQSAVRLKGGHSVRI